MGYEGLEVARPATKSSMHFNYTSPSTPSVLSPPDPLRQTQATYRQHFYDDHDGDSHLLRLCLLPRHRQPSRKIATFACGLWSLLSFCCPLALACSSVAASRSRSLLARF